VLHVGVCNVTVEQLALARSVVEIATVQSPFNLADTSRADLLAECEAHGIGFMPYRPPRRERRSGVTVPRRRRGAGNRQRGRLVEAPPDGLSAAGRLRERVAARLRVV